MAVLNELEPKEVFRFFRRNKCNPREEAEIQSASVIIWSHLQKKET